MNQIKTPIYNLDYGYYKYETNQVPTNNNYISYNTNYIYQLFKWHMKNKFI